MWSEESERTRIVMIMIMIITMIYEENDQSIFLDSIFMIMIWL
jgi:hypothetical protein